jgi:iron(II)-dependent oxidoreductase
MQFIRNGYLLSRRTGTILLIVLLVSMFWGCGEDDVAGLPSPQPIIDGDRVLVPEGNVVLGNTPEGWGNYELEAGINPVHLDSFYIDRYEITNLKYVDYLNTAINLGQVAVDDSGDVYDPLTDKILVRVSSEYCHINYDSISVLFEAEDGYSDLPVVMVSWYGAYNYSTFYGKRLPTESEWEKAARGIVDVFGSYGGTGVGYPYPWGDVRPTESLANFGDVGGAPESVYAHLGGMSWFGAHNMAGNVREWTATAIGSARIHRGGSYLSIPEQLKTATRAFTDPIVTDRAIGFRCASDP